MFGVVAVGTEDGHIYLLDLRCDDLTEDFSTSRPSGILVIDPSECDDVVALRPKARLTHKHCCIDLSCKCTKSI